MAADWTRDLEVVCADIGSIARGNFGWARRRLGDDGPEDHDPGDIGDFVEAVAAALARGRAVAVGFEAPLVLPVPIHPASLCKARPCDPPSPAWCSGPGSSVLAAGLAQTAWILESVRTRTNPHLLSFEWEEFAHRKRGLLVWEAFISGADKGATHEEDALAAVDAFCAQLPHPGDPRAADIERPFSLIAAAAAWAGWEVPVESLRGTCLVVRPGHGRSA